MSRISRISLALSLILLAAILGLGVRSFWWCDTYMIAVKSNTRIAFATHEGRRYLISAEQTPNPGGTVEFHGDLGYKCPPANSPDLGMENFEPRFLIFRWLSISAWFGNVRSLGIPLWLIGGLVALPWLFIWIRHRRKIARGRGFEVEIANPRFPAPTSPPQADAGSN